MSGLLANRLVRARTLAKHYGLSLRTLQLWCASGDIPAKKIGSQWYVDLRALMLRKRSDDLAELAREYIIESDE